MPPKSTNFGTDSSGQQISVKEYVDQRIDALEKGVNSNRTESISIKEYVDVRLKAISESTDLAAGLLNHRLESMNEFRAAMKDQSSLLLTKSEYQVRHDRVLAEISDLKESRAILQGKASQHSVNYAIAFAVLSLLVSIVLSLLRIIMH